MAEDPRTDECEPRDDDPEAERVRDDPEAERVREDPP